MQPFTPDLGADLHTRRSAAFSVLDDIILSGIAMDIENRKKLKGAFDNERHEQYNTTYIEKLRDNYAEETSKSLKQFNLGTVEQVAVIRSTDEGKRPPLHRIAFSADGWHEAAGKEAESILLDLVSMRRSTITCTPGKLPALYEMYDAVRIPVGTLHTVSNNHPRDVAEALVSLSSLSRMLGVQARRYQIKDQGLRREGLKETREYVLHQEHLSSEWIAYVTEDPRRRRSISEFMQVQKKPLTEFDPEYFMFHQSTHPSLSEGVL